MAKANVFQVSQTKIALWRKCKYATYLRYTRGLRRRIKARPLQFGTLVHKMLEADAEGQNPFKVLNEATKGQKLFAAEREELEEIASDVRFIMRDYFDFWENNPLIYIKQKKRKAEHEVQLELCPGIVLIVKLDAFAKDKKGIWLTEHKTFSQLPSEDHRWRNLQSNVYKFAVDKLDIEVDGICWNYIRSKPPTEPKLLESGALSKKRIDTLPSKLKSFFKENAVDDKKLMQNAYDNRKRYFIRAYSAFRKPTVKLILADFIESAKDMAQYLGILKAKTIDRHCDWCEFEPICRAELTGGNAELIIKKEYTDREQRETELAQAD